MGFPKYIQDSLTVYFWFLKPFAKQLPPTNLWWRRYLSATRRDVHLLLNLDPEQFAAHNRAQARGIDQPDQGDEER